MNKLSQKSLVNIFQFLDYLTQFQIKYTCKKINAIFKETELGTTLDLRNVKYPRENNVIYKILNKHKFLKKVILEFREINDTHVMKFNPNITYINLNYCQRLTDNSLVFISKTCPLLTHLELYIIPSLTDKGLSEIFKHCTKISYLNLSGCKHFTDESLMLITKNLKDLSFLDLTRCLGLTDKFLIELMKNNSKLTHLNLYALPELECTFLGEMCFNKLEFLDLCGNQGVNDELLEKAAKFLTNIKSLNFSWCKKVTDKGIKALFGQGVEIKLELISLHGLLGITDEGIECMHANRGIVENLNTIDLNACSNVKNRSKEYLLTKFPKLTVFAYFM